ncbi:hypothetical protein FBEOM_2189 [Fusarium beomiforme]|uniref:Uncharacterized protein n=1 Tax=Fusarium beomiforme TaxID=44412 RepID=A0A9P5E0D5_9HYPO|nr:hypothetical protein FBEOM_2189 [Fusarium beomiforme]
MISSSKNITDTLTRSQTRASPDDLPFESSSFDVIFRTTHPEKAKLGPSGKRKTSGRVILLTRRRLPFSAVKWDEMQDIILACNPAIEDLLLTSRDAAVRHITTTFDLYRSQLKAKLQASVSKIHLSTDLWTSPHRHGILAVCVRWVDNGYRLQKALLAMPECRYSHSGERQATLMAEAIEEYGIAKQIGYHTGDNATSNDTCLKHLCQMLQDKYGISFHPNQRRIRCIAHIINLFLQAFILASSKEALRAALAAASDVTGAEMYEQFYFTLYEVSANEAVLRYCQPTFVRHQQGPEAYQQGLADWNEFFNHWHSIMKSSDEKAFDQRVQELERRYLPQYIEEVGYIKANWLDPYKERLARAWVDQHPHFGNVVTSRVEGIHGLLKSHLKKSTLDLFEAWRAMKHALLNQLAELQSNQASQQRRIPIELSGSLYSAIRGWVSHEALRKVEEQRKLLLKEHLPVCTGAFSRSHGPPCARTLKALQEQNQPLRLEHFHTHWQLNRHGVHRLLLEPRHRPNRIAAGSSTMRPQSSTQREPSAFEAVQATTRPKA